MCGSQERTREGGAKRDVWSFDARRTAMSPDAPNQGGFSMLVLSRKSGECVRIGQSIEVKVLEVNGGRGKLGFPPPPGGAIQRNEICGAYPHPFGSWQPCPTIGELCAP